ncbi:zinc-dependent peptidase [Porticoccus sp.]
MVALKVSLPRSVLAFFTDAMCLKLATMAVPLLHLGLDWYDRWQTVILYEDAFVPNRPYRTEDGVVHPRGPHQRGPHHA